MIFLQCLLLSSVTIWVFAAIAGLVCVILCIMACAKWGCYYCLASPLWDCLEVFWKQLKRFFWFLVRILKTMLFYVSLVVTTIVYTFACCICFVVIQEWPWVRAYTGTYRRNSFDEKYQPVATEKLMSNTITDGNTLADEKS